MRWEEASLTSLVAEHKRLCDDEFSDAPVPQVVDVRPADAACLHSDAHAAGWRKGRERPRVEGQLLRRVQH